MKSAMKTSFVLSIGLLLLCILTGCSNTIPTVAVQVEMNGILRSTVETMPEETRTPILDYMDRARPIADNGIQYFVENDKDKLYDLMIEEYKEQYSIEDFKLSIEKMVEAFGQITDFEYRNQGFEYPVGQEPIKNFTNAQTKVVYFVNTTKSSIENATFFEIALKKVGSEFYIYSCNYISYPLNRIPSWLLSPNAPVQPPP